MKISLVISLVGSAHGGLQVLVMRLAQQLKKKGHEVRIIGRFTQARPLPDYPVRMETPQVFTAAGVEVEIISVQGLRRWLLGPVYRLIWRPVTFPVARMLYEFAFQPAMDQALKETDLVHYFGVGVELLGFAARASARKQGVPFVVEPALHLGQWGEARPDQLLYQEADRVIAHSQFEAQRLLELGVREERLDVVYPGVDVTVGGEPARFRTKYGIEGPIVLFLGRKTKAKGVGLLLEAFPEIRRKFSGSRLVLAGPSGDAFAPLPEGVVDVGMLDENDKADALAACDLLCVPSEGESFGFVYFEAGAYGKPVVGLDLPTLRETIGLGGAGILVERTASALSQAIIQFLENPDFAERMGQAGLALAAQHAWAKAIERFQIVYEKCKPAAEGGTF